MATKAILDEIVSKELPYTFRQVLSNSVAGEAKMIGTIFACLATALSYQKSTLKHASYSNEKIIENCIIFVERNLRALESNNILLSNIQAVYCRLYVAISLKKI